MKLEPERATMQKHAANNELGRRLAAAYVSYESLDRSRLHLVQKAS